MEIRSKSANMDHKDYDKYFAKSHIQRIYILGDNLPESNWFTNMDLIKLKDIHLFKEKIDHLLKNINRNAVWKKSWIRILKAMAIIYYPIYLILLQHYRRKIWNKIQSRVYEANKVKNQEILCWLRGSCSGNTDCTQY